MNKATKFLLCKRKMKIRLLKLAVCFVGLLFMCFECGECEPESYMEWYFKNTTDKKMILYRYYGETRISITIPQYKDTLLTCAWIYTVDEEDDDFDQLWYGVCDSISIQINGKIVQTWRKSERDEPGKQFFNSQFWTKSLETREEKTCTVWTFEILPEDIGAK